MHLTRTVGLLCNWAREQVNDDEMNIKDCIPLTSNSERKVLYLLVVTTILATHFALQLTITLTWTEHGTALHGGFEVKRSFKCFLIINWILRGFEYFSRMSYVKCECFCATSVRSDLQHFFIVSLWSLYQICIVVCCIHVSSIWKSHHNLYFPCWWPQRDVR